MPHRDAAPPRRPAARAARAACALALLAALAAPARAANPEPPPSATEAEPEDIAATWYADGSCTLDVGRRLSTGKAAIDADFDEIGARTLVHCDTEDGRRVTMLSRGGDALSLGERTMLLSPHEIDAGLDGSIAWLALSGEEFADETAPRRFVLEGKVLIRSTPVTEAAGAAPHTDKQPFAELSGRVESLVRHPFPARGATSKEAPGGDPKRAAVTR